MAFFPRPVSVFAVAMLHGVGNVRLDRSLFPLPSNHQRNWEATGYLSWLPTELLSLTHSFVVAAESDPRERIHRAAHRRKFADVLYDMQCFVDKFFSERHLAIYGLGWMTRSTRLVPMKQPLYGSKSLKMPEQIVLTWSWITTETIDQELQRRKKERKRKHRELCVDLNTFE
jgi:hypothetical protein